LAEVSPKNGYRFGISMAFADRRAYERYNEHPDHVRFVQERWLSEVKDSSNSTTRRGMRLNKHPGLGECSKVSLDAENINEVVARFIAAAPRYGLEFV
jgi:hypothetical protein